MGFFDKLFGKKSEKSDLMKYYSKIKCQSVLL